MFHHQRELVSQVGSLSEWILIINVINDIKDCLFPSHILHACVKQHISSWKQYSLSDSTQRVPISFMFDCACPVWTATTQQLKETDSNLGYKRKRTVVFHHIRIKPNSKGAYVKPPGIDVHSAVDSLPCLGLRQWQASFPIFQLHSACFFSVELFDLLPIFLVSSRIPL